MFEVIGIVGSLASIVALFLPANSMKNRLIHAAYVLVIVIVTTIGYSYKNKLERIESAERAATVLLEDRRNKYSSGGFNMAALSFLEKYQDLYPDSYARALDLCSNNSCLKNQYEEGGNSLNHAFAQINVSSALAGMLQGISVLSSEK
ncbi:hypothetical protein [Vibrio cholerae]|uniref:hypothetical protein n=1 Tax=Vibrio cholerae TaxID=666 RepID=UPI00155E48FE|nr:hypothetical protein [Vibrio cholerae]MBJ6896276.1 hypothetical protein [Vibrio cholerae]MBJ6899809.1 hypothetical protein [Vibrio cholerae]MBJ6903424.1 hypothetical protein [Vibrio cholerae]NOE77538.1 hypothetical protein [Vibrio cholerae]